MPAWAFLTNHARVLLCVADRPGIRLVDVADCAGVTERTAWRILADLEEEGYLTRHRPGARNVYEIHPDRPLKHPMEDGLVVGDLLQVLLERKRESETETAPAR